MNLVQFLFEYSKNLQKEAIVGTKEKVSYPSLFESINRISFFIAQHYNKETKIGILAENSSFFIASYLGIIKAGCIAVPFDKRIFPQTAMEIINLCEMPFAFVQNKYIDKFAGIDISVMDETKISEENALKMPGVYGEKFLGSDEDPAVIIFTSGTMGKKKGVVLSHKNIIANTQSIISYLKLTESDRIEVVLPFFYCYGTSLLHTHLRVGGSFVLNSSIFLGSVIKEINQYKCTGFAGVPSTFQILLRNTDFKEHTYATLRYVTQAGGKLANCLIEELSNSLPDTDVVTMYGQTEATARLSYLPPDLLETKLGSIGKGIPGVEINVVDKEGKTIAPGKTGEIVAKGDNIMLGYYKDPEETKQTIKNGYLYTGDLAKVDEEGYIYLISREKELIKSAGYRIGPKEIEDFIISNPKVISCSVVGISDEIMGESIICYIVSNEKSQAVLSEIKTLCNQKLPSYMVPKHMALIESIPLNSSGKPDKTALVKLAEKQFLGK